MLVGSGAQRKGAGRNKSVSDSRGTMPVLDQRRS